jgi:hypothetical protein
MKKLLVLSPIILCLMSCVPPYQNYYLLDSQYLNRRQIETRRFETSDEQTMLIASSQLLQDLGFALEESETKLGLITASKDREGASTAAKIGLTLLAALAGTQATWDEDQRIYATLVSTKSRGASGFNVRIGFARIIRDNHGHTRIEKITAPEIYKDFFDKLGQSLFLTANDI